MYCTKSQRLVKKYILWLRSCRYVLLLRQMHACSNFSRLDVLLIQPLFIPLSIDISLHSLKLLPGFKNALLGNLESVVTLRMIIERSSNLDKRKETFSSALSSESCSRQHVSALSLLFCRYIKCAALHFSFSLFSFLFFS